MRSAERRKLRWSPVHVAVVSALVAALAACTTAPPERLPAPVPGRFAASGDVPGSAAALGWREVFRDPGLQALIEAALTNNRDVRIAAARMEQARAAMRIEGAQLFPTIDAVATGTRARSPADRSLTGRAATSGSYQAALSAAWEIDLWGRLRNARASAVETYLASTEGRRAVATSLIAQVANAWLLDGEYAERIELARRTVATRQEALRMMRRRFEVGAGSRLDMNQAELLLRQAELALQGLEGDRAVNRDALALLVGEPVNPRPARLDLAQLDRPLPAGLPSELLVNRPDVAAAEHRLRAAHADIGAARAAFFPSISLTASGGVASSALERLFRSGQGAWSFTPTLVAPIFNAGRNAAVLDLAQARRDEAVADYELTVQQAFRDVSDALARRAQLAQQIATTEQLLAALEDRARLATLRFDNGRSAYLEVLDAQRDLFAAQQELVQLRRAYLASGVALYSALGGGFADGQSFAAPPPIQSQRPAP